MAVASTADRRTFFIRLLLVVAALYLCLYATAFGRLVFDSYGYLYGPGRPFGADFINLWSAGRLVLAGTFEAIYRPDAFMAYEQSLVGEHIGYRLWAYPPHALLLIWPFALGGYHLMFVAWSVVGLVVLAAGARRFGFNWSETAVLTVSPASLQCITSGQSGSLACGLMLLALAGTSLKKPSAAIAAALLTVKPQTGFLIPLLWLMQRRWGLIIATGVLAASLVAMSILVFGVQAWREYLTITLPALSTFEKQGNGPFLYMIPSLFVSLRLIGVDGATASSIHLVFAAAVLVLLLWRLRRAWSQHQQIALILIATCLITPYLHFYDLSILLAGAMITLRLHNGEAGSNGFAAAGVAIAWVLPIAIGELGQLGIPISPLLILAVFAIAAWSPPRGRAA